MKRTDLIQWLHSDIVGVLDTTTLTSFDTPAQHVGLARGSDNHPYPFVGIDTADTTPDSMGIGNETLVVDSLEYDADGVLQSRTYRRETPLPVTIQVLTDGERELRSDLTDELHDHFNLTQEQGAFPADVDTIDDRGVTISGRPDEFVYGHGLRLTITYKQYITDDDPDVAEEVDLTFDVADDVDGTDSATAFDDIIQ